MGNEISSLDQEHRDNERNALVPLENRAEVIRTPKTRRRRKSPPHISKKRTHTQLTHQPTGELHHESGNPPNNRWPIVGVSPNVLLSQGELSIQQEEEGLIVRWTLDARVYLPTESDVTLPRAISSSAFKLHSMGSRLLWRLTIAPKDDNDDCLSLYLESVNGQSKEAFPIETQFSLAIEKLPVKTQILSQFSLSKVETETKVPVWGIRNAVTLKSILECIGRHDHQLSITFRLIWIRDAYLFPPRFITVPSKIPELYLISVSPKIFMIEQFLTMDMCETLIEFATPHLYRSRVSSGAETASRTSSSMFFTGSMGKLDIVRTIEEKMMALMLRPEINQGRIFVPNESLQAVRYHMGEFYAEHYDNRSGQSHLRAATLITYLRDTDGGGATYFPRATMPSNAESLLPSSPKKRHGRQQGLRIYPKCGRAILFFSRLPNKEEDKTSLHAAEPVMMGEKWIATRWFKEIDPCPED